MTYQEELCLRISNIKKWPDFERLDFLTDLNAFADKFHAGNTIEGYLAALLIYHQLCEEIIKQLIKCSNFYIQCKIFPNEIETVNFNNKRMFGQLIDVLKKGVINKDIKEFINKCEKLNALRIDIVHKITSKNSITEIAQKSKQAKRYFDDILKLFSDIDGVFYHGTFLRYQKKSEKENWLESIINNS